jgi:hypothetical protein
MFQTILLKRQLEIGNVHFSLLTFQQALYEMRIQMFYDIMMCQWRVAPDVSEERNSCILRAKGFKNTTCFDIFLALEK